MSNTKSKQLPLPTPVASILDNEKGAIVPICIRTSQGGYLLAVDGGGIGSPDSGLGATALRTDVTSPGKLEIFTVIEKSATSFALQTPNGCFVSAVDGGGKGSGYPASSRLPIVTNGTLMQAGTSFQLVLLGAGQVRLLTSDLKHYVTAVGGGGIDEVGDAISTEGTSADDDTLLEFVQIEVLMSHIHNGPG